MHREENLMKLNLSLLIKYDQLVGNYNTIWNKFSNRIKKKFDNKPVYNEKHLKTKIKS